MHDAPTCFYWHGDTIRSRSVSSVVLCGTVDIPALPARLVADWEREVQQQLGLEPGDVEQLPLARARMRWPDYRLCVKGVTDWTHTVGLAGALATSDIALMACRGARYHHDGSQYGYSAFCNLFLNEDRGLDLHFPFTGQRIALRRGTAVVFDTCQPHAVIARNRSGFDAADFPSELDCTQTFLTWELPIENANVVQALQISFDTDPSTSSLLVEAQLRRKGAQTSVCPHSGRWMDQG
jgi:hypothetical protein